MYMSKLDQSQKGEAEEISSRFLKIASDSADITWGKSRIPSDCYDRPNRCLGQASVWPRGAKR